MIDREALIELKAVLAAEIAGYRHLLGVCQRQRETILAADGPQIQSTMAEQYDIIGGCRGVSSERLLLVAALAAELDLEEPHTLGRLIASLPDEMGDLIRAETESLRMLCAEIRELSERIVRISEHRLDLLQGDFNEMLRIVREQVIPSENASEQGNLISTQA